MEDKRIIIPPGDRGEVYVACDIEKLSMIKGMVEALCYLTDGALGAALENVSEILDEVIDGGCYGRKDS